MKATVLWFNDVLGYGLAETEDGTKVFCHKTQVKSKKTLKQGQKILFDLYEKKRYDGSIGYEAKNIEEE